MQCMLEFTQDTLRCTCNLLVFVQLMLKFLSIYITKLMSQLLSLRQKWKNCDFLKKLWFFLQKFENRVVLAVRLFSDFLFAEESTGIPNCEGQPLTTDWYFPDVDSVTIVLLSKGSLVLICPPRSWQFNRALPQPFQSNFPVLTNRRTDSIPVRARPELKIGCLLLSVHWSKPELTLPQSYNEQSRAP